VRRVRREHALPRDPRLDPLQQGVDGPDERPKLTGCAIVRKPPVERGHLDGSGLRGGCAHRPQQTPHDEREDEGRGEDRRPEHQRELRQVGRQEGSEVLEPEGVAHGRDRHLAERRRHWRKPHDAGAVERQLQRAATRQHPHQGLQTPGKLGGRAGQDAVAAHRRVGEARTARGVLGELGGGGHDERSPVAPDRRGHAAMRRCGRQLLVVDVGRDRHEREHPEHHHGGLHERQVAHEARGQRTCGRHHASSSI
jgi:hypothetical protein